MSLPDSGKCLFISKTKVYRQKKEILVDITFDIISKFEKELYV